MAVNLLRKLLKYVGKPRHVLDRSPFFRAVSMFTLTSWVWSARCRMRGVGIQCSVSLLPNQPTPENDLTIILATCSSSSRAITLIGMENNMGDAVEAAQYGSAPTPKHPTKVSCNDTKYRGLPFQRSCVLPFPIRLEFHNEYRFRQTDAVFFGGGAVVAGVDSD